MSFFCWTVYFHIVLATLFCNVCRDSVSAVELINALFRTEDSQNRTAEFESENGRVNWKTSAKNHKNGFFETNAEYKATNQIHQIGEFWLHHIIPKIVF